ncbi:hypothetical protein GCM10009634_61080 [Saccharothrix xinjiangensis]
MTDLDGLWPVLVQGRDVVGGPPADRFDTQRYWDGDQVRPGKSYTFTGGYLDDLAGFDAEYFGISPRAAANVDPQQRLLLELGVEAHDLGGVPAGPGGHLPRHRRRRRVRRRDRAVAGRPRRPAPRAGQPARRRRAPRCWTVSPTGTTSTCS